MIEAVIFDVGRVLISWDPNELFKEFFKSNKEIENFLEEINFYEWNLSMDKGKPFSIAIAEKTKEFPQYKKEIEAFGTDWKKTIPGAQDEPVSVLRDLKKANFPIYALTNFASMRFEETKKRFDFFSLFDGIVVSGDEKMVKPDDKIFKLICKRYNLEPEKSLFIDDNEANIETANRLGFKTILFKYPDLLRPQVEKFGVKF